MTTYSTSAVMTALDSFLQSDIDALPYADEHTWTPEMQTRAARLIDEEMKAAAAAGTTPTTSMAAITKELEDAAKANARAEEKFATCHPLAYAALQEAATKMEKKKTTTMGGMSGRRRRRRENDVVEIDDDEDDDMVMQRRCEVGQDGDAAAWRTAADAACARLEHRRLQLLNLTLTAKHGAQGWRARNVELEQEMARIRDEADQIRKTLDTMHADRRAEQAEAADEIYEATREADALRQKLRGITDAIASAEEQLRKQAKQM